MLNMFRLLLFVCYLCAMMLPVINAIPVDNSSSSALQQLSPGSSGAGRAIESVAFSAVRASDKSRKANSKILFDTTLSDIGFGWNPKTSEFVCFYPGSYFFTFTAISASGHHFKAALMKNSDEIVVGWGEQVGFQSASNSAILNLEKSDRVYINIREGEIYETSKVGHHGYTSFSGFRVH